MPHEMADEPGVPNDRELSGSELWLLRRLLNKSLGKRSPALRQTKAIAPWCKSALVVAKRSITNRRWTTEPLKPQPRRLLDTDEVPTIEVRAKDAWFDDQGFRATPSRVSFKQRF